MIHDNKQLIIKDNEVANAFGKHYSKVGETYYRNEFKIRNKMIEREEVKVNKSDSPKEELTYNRNFSVGELLSVLGDFKNTSPGADSIPYQMIRELKKESILQLLSFYNQVWCKSTIPEQWKQSQLIPLPKPGKLHIGRTSYRPIALTNCLGKMMEKIVTQRLIYYLESEEKINSKVVLVLCIQRMMHQLEYSRTLD